MCRDLSATPPARILEVILEAILHTGPNKARVLGYWEIQVDKERRRRGKDMLKPVRSKGGQA